MYHQNYIHYGILNLDRNALTPTYVHDNDLIQPGNEVQIGMSPIGGTNSHNNPHVAAAEYKHKGCLLIREIWTKETEFIVNMRDILLSEDSGENYPLG